MLLDLLTSSIHVNTTDQIHLPHDLDYYLCTDNGKFVTRLCDEGRFLNFPIVNILFFDSTSTLAPSYGETVSQSG